MIIQPLVFQEAAIATGVSSDVLVGSGVIFQLCTGFAPIPEHLTEELALKEEEEERKHAGNNNRILGKRMRIETEGKKIDVKINQEVSVVELEHETPVRARVTRVETVSTDGGEEETIVYAKPIYSQFAGSYYEFELSIDEYEAAVQRAENETLGS
jgi:hypothetical protein